MVAASGFVVKVKRFVLSPRTLFRGAPFFNYIANIVFEIWMVNKFFEAVEKYLIINVDIALNQDGVRYLLVVLMF